eukprot:CAMPEP_0119040906 /NCGR_PEP_ID=MMETSP1177-20130426/10972_1 /TAXON_ID=2985 /ORGANISM="Ochromonas sp, Strain CCMP1899" /LENGTH=811 /DNA_ID=CAMNT_0007006435 /DNA_START=2524 /DNA_END=4959 /DNA_ORIENTATION=+
MNKTRDVIEDKKGILDVNNDAHNDKHIDARKDQNDNNDSKDKSFACLSFPSDQPVTFSFTLDIPESILSTLPPGDHNICVEEIHMLIRTPIYNDLNEAADEGSTSKNGSRFFASEKGSDERVCREMVLRIFALSGPFRKAIQERGAYVAGKQAHTLKDLGLFLGPLHNPEILELTRPIARLELLSPSAKKSEDMKMTQGVLVSKIPTANFLQGPIQRLDLIFKSGDNHVINGKVYVSSDYSPSSINAALFWTPDINALESIPIVQRSSDVLDSIQFHPVMLNSIYQPEEPILLPYVPPNTVYCIPLFLRSEIKNSFKLKILSEFLPKFENNSTVSKEFEINISFLKPLNINFVLSSYNDYECGIIRDESIHTVLQGDTVNVAATLGCAEALGKEIEILSMKIIQSKMDSISNDYYDDNSNINDDNSPGDKEEAENIFKFSNNLSYMNLTDDVEYSIHENCRPVKIDQSNNCNDNDDNGLLTLIQPVKIDQSNINGNNDDCLDIVTSNISLVDLDNQENVNEIMPVDDIGIHITSDSDNNKSHDNKDSSVRTSNTNKLFLKKGETFVASGDVYCIESHLPPSALISPIIASIGELCIDWRLRDNDIFSPPNLNFWGKTRGVNEINNEIDQGGELDWFLQWGIKPHQNSVDNNGLAVEDGITTTRVCGMVFKVPQVRVASSPFEVTINIPSIAPKNEIINIEINIINKLWTPEHISLNITGILNGLNLVSENENNSFSDDSHVTPCCGFFVVGNTSALLDVSPKGTCMIALCMVPLSTGFLPLPRICVTWERNNANIVEIGSKLNPKCIFIRP